jgi:hypothetical protein
VTISAADRFSTGPARFVFLLEDPRGEPVANASVHLRFSFIDPVRDDRKTLKSELSATPVDAPRTHKLQSITTPCIEPTNFFASKFAFVSPHPHKVTVQCAYLSSATCGLPTIASAAFLLHSILPSRGTPAHSGGGARCYPVNPVMLSRQCSLDITALQPIEYQQ